MDTALEVLRSRFDEQDPKLPNNGQ
jgi:hypothetical protein